MIAFVMASVLSVNRSDGKDEQWNVGQKRDGNRTRIFLGRSESSWVEAIVARKVKI